MEQAKGEDVDDYLAITAKGGTCVVTAVGNSFSSETKLNLAMLTLPQKNMQGTIFGGCNPRHDTAAVVGMPGQPTQSRRHDRQTVHLGADQRRLEV